MEAPAEVRRLRAKRHRRAVLLGLVGSAGVHAALFALLGWRVHLAPVTDGAPRAAQPADRFLAQRPLQVVRLTPATAGRTGDSGPPTARANETAPAAKSPRAIRRPARAPTGLPATPVLSRAGLPVVELGAWLEEDNDEAALGAPVAFRAASDAARQATGRQSRDGRRGGGIGISIGLGGMGGDDCSAPGPPTGIVDNFAGALPGAGRAARGRPGRRGPLGSVRPVGQRLPLGGGNRVRD